MNIATEIKGLPAIIVHKTCKYTRKPVWAVEYNGQRSNWTTYEGEAISWADTFISMGYCMSARPNPIPPSEIEAKAEGIAKAAVEASYKPRA